MIIQVQDDNGPPGFQSDRVLGQVSVPEEIPPGSNTIILVGPVKDINDRLC